MPTVASPEQESRTESEGESWTRTYRFDLIWALIVAALVLAAFLVPHFHLRRVRPLVDVSASLGNYLGETAPVLGRWMPHVGWGTPIAIAVAVAVVWWGSQFAERLPWRSLLVGAWLASVAWTMALALIDGWSQGFVARSDSSQGYLAMVTRVDGIPSMLRSFASQIPLSSTRAWDIQVSAHPAGALLTFVLLDRIGLHGPVWASLFCVATGTSSAVAVLIALRVLSSERMARRAAPFLVLAPAAVWVAVSADAYFAGVAAWALALLALAATRTVRAPLVAALGSGLLFGLAVYVDYGLVLMAIPILAVVVIAGNPRPLIGLVCGSALVAALFTGFGFSWFEGLRLLRHRYSTGIAMNRPYDYWVWANLVSLTCAIGWAGATALRRAFSAPALRRRDGLPVLMVAFVLAIVAADLSGLSKAETERIWLPFSLWLVAAPALMPTRSHRLCLCAQAVGAILINSLLFTTW